MRKVILLAAMLSLSTAVITSCSSDDSTPTVNPDPNPNPDRNPDPGNEQPLSVEADSETVFLGDTVTFSANTGGVAVTGVTYYVDERLSAVIPILYQQWVRLM